MSYEFLQTLWFILIAVLWIGFFFLEGFDFGVGMLLPFLGKKDVERRAIINTIGSVWDGNEVWLLTAGGATFAASRTGMPPCSAAFIWPCSCCWSA
jgi:cytochrome d ubiquinol oxidase subunit II